MAEAERVDGGRRFDLVLKLRFDATPLTFDPCAAAAAAAIGGSADRGLTVHAASDKVFWGSREAMSVAAALYESIGNVFEADGAEERGGRVSVRALLEMARGVPEAAWSDRKSIRQHYNKVSACNCACSRRGSSPSLFPAGSPIPLILDVTAPLLHRWPCSPSL